MLNSDFDSFKAFLESNWPNRFTDHDIRYWLRELQPWEIERVIEKLVEFKNTKKFPPKPPEIKDACQKAWPVQLQPTNHRGRIFRNVLAAQWAQSHPKMESEPESVLVVSYYRYCFFRNRKLILGISEAPSEQDKERIAQAKRRWVSECNRSLASCGLTVEEADAASTWVDATEVEIESVFDQLRAIDEARQSEKAA